MPRPCVSRASRRTVRAVDRMWPATVAASCRTPSRNGELRRDWNRMPITYSPGTARDAVDVPDLSGRVEDRHLQPRVRAAGIRSPRRHRCPRARGAGPFAPGRPASDDRRGSGGATARLETAAANASIRPSSRAAGVAPRRWWRARSSAKCPPAVDRAQPAGEPTPRSCSDAQVHVPTVRFPTSCSDGSAGSRGRAPGRRPVEQAHRVQPPHDVHAPVTPRHPGVAAHREDHLPSGGGQFVGELGAGRRGADDEHPAVRQARRRCGTSADVSCTSRGIKRRAEFRYGRQRRTIRSPRRRRRRSRSRGGGHREPVAPAAVPPAPRRLATTGAAKARRVRATGMRRPRRPS